MGAHTGSLRRAITRSHDPAFHPVSAPSLHHHPATRLSFLQQKPHFLETVLVPIVYGSGPQTRCSIRAIWARPHPKPSETEFSGTDRHRKEICIYILLFLQPFGIKELILTTRKNSIFHDIYFHGNFIFLLKASEDSWVKGKEILRFSLFFLFPTTPAPALYFFLDQFGGLVTGKSQI